MVVVGFGTLFPASATGPLLKESGSNYNGPIIYSANSAWGSGITGFAGANGGYGVVGNVVNTVTNAPSTGVYGTVGGPSGTGVYAESRSTDTTHPGFGLFATSTNGNGMFVQTHRGDVAAAVIENSVGIGTGLQAIGAGNAVLAESTYRNGAVGQTSFKSGLSGTGYAGVLGQDLSNDQGIGNSGVAGVSPSGFGLSGTSTADGTGVGGFSTTGIGVFGTSANNLAMFGNSQNSIGVEGYSASNIGMIAESEATPDPSDPSGVNGPPALQVVTTSGSPAIKVTSSGGDIMSLDTSGNLIISGNLTVDGNVSVQGTSGACPSCPTPLVRGRSTAVNGISPAASATEAMGEGRLTLGAAYVRFDPAFAASSGNSYLVFITPQGDSRGLYVTQKSPAGFAVREGMGGRSTIAFDYRIVASPAAAGSTAQGVQRGARGTRPLHTPAATLRLARYPLAHHLIVKPHYGPGLVPRPPAVPNYRVREDQILH
jgi:hypothetical protein